jgi:DNA-binding MarR family transcriptional regulator
MSLSLHHELFELLRRYNMQGKFAGGVYDTPLSPLEAYIVVEVSVHDKPSINDIVEILGVDRSAISRAISRLCKIRYLQAVQSKEDQRLKQLSTTTLGEEFLALHDQFNSRFLAQLAQGLDSAELDELARYLDYLATKDGALPIVLRPGESELLRGMRRLARCWDVLTGSFLQTEYSVLHWQILTEISTTRGGIRPQRIGYLLSLPKSTLSQILSRYRAAGLIVQKRARGDGRGFTLLLTNKGRAVVTKISDTGALRIKKALAHLSKEEQSRFLELLRRYVIKPQGTTLLSP